MKVYYCENCKEYVEEDELKECTTSYEEEYGISDLFPGSSTTLRYDICPYCESDDIYEVSTYVCNEIVANHVKREFQHLKSSANVSNEYLEVAELFLEKFDFVYDSIEFKDEDIKYFAEIDVNVSILTKFVDEFIKISGNIKKAIKILNSDDIETIEKNCDDIAQIATDILIV